MSHVYDTEYAMGEFEFSGEKQLMDKLSKYDLKTIFDVGTNIGEWSRMVRKTQPNSKIHMFEPIPEVFSNLLTNNVLDSGMMPNPMGLSDGTGTMLVNHTEDNDRLTSPILDMYDGKTREVFCAAGDIYCKSRGIDSIDFLKIDTEGWEYAVLQGFEDSLRQGLIAIIQFEYGYANILTKNLLIDFYRMLLPYGYVLGKLTPAGVYFSDYSVLLEDFKGPNYVAVHSKAPDFMELISGT